MKTLKKVLALLLVLAMSLSLMSVAAFADGETFADESPAAEDVAAVEETTAEETSSESNVTNETTEAVSAEPETVEQAAEESPEEPAETADEVAEESTDEVEETIDEVEEPTEVETPEETAKTPAEEIVEELPAPVEQPVLTEEELAAQAEAERLAAEEAARLEAERLAAEEAARLEAERLAALERRWPKSDKELVFDTESYRVTVTVPESAFADHVYFRVIEMQWAELDEATAELLKASGLTEDDALLDIGFEDADGFEVEPDAAIGVSIEAAETEIAEVYHVEDAETVAKVAEDDAAFEVGSFSLFVVKAGATSGIAVTLDDGRTATQYATLAGAVAAASSGDTIILGSGEYPVPSSISKGITITGAGKDKTTLVLTQALSVTSNDSEFTIENLSVQGTGNVSFYGSSNVTISNVSLNNGQEDYRSGGITLYGNGGTYKIENTTIIKAFKAIHIIHTGPVVIDNCYLDSVYPFNCNGSNGDVTVTDSTLLGWTSWNCGASSGEDKRTVSFSDCTFGASVDYGYAYLRPYNDVTFTRCTFADGFEIGDALANLTYTFKSCKKVDTTLNKENILTSNIIDNDDHTNSLTIIIDGGEYSFALSAWSNMAAKIGDDYYDTLADAIAAVPTDGTVNSTTITLLKDYTNPVSFNTSGKSFTLDLNKQTLTFGAGNNHVDKNSVVTICNGNLVFAEDIGGDCFIGIGAYNGSVNALTLDHIKLTGDGYSSAYAVLDVYDGNNRLTIKDSEVTLKNEKSSVGGAFKASAGTTAKIEISNSQIDLENVVRGFIYADVTITDSAVTIKGGDNGINQSKLTIDHSNIAISGGSGRGITLSGQPVVIKNDSVVIISDMREGDVQFKDDKNITIQDSSRLTAKTRSGSGSGSIIAPTGYTLVTTDNNDGSKTYTVTKQYTVKFVNWDNKVLQSGFVAQGAVPSYSGTPTRTATTTNTYTFSGWSDGTTTYAANASLPAATGNATYKATYNEVPVASNDKVTVTEATGNDGEKIVTVEDKTDASKTVTTETVTKEETAAVLELKNETETATVTTATTGETNTVGATAEKTVKKATSIGTGEGTTYTYTVKTYVADVSDQADAAAAKTAVNAALETKVNSNEVQTSTTVTLKAEKVDAVVETKVGTVQNTALETALTTGASTEAKANVITTAQVADTALSKKMTDLAAAEEITGKAVTVDVTLTLETKLTDYKVESNEATTVTFDVKPILTTVVKIDGVQQGEAKPETVSNDDLNGNITVKLPIPASFVPEGYTPGTTTIQIKHMDDSGKLKDYITGTINGDSAGYYVQFTVTEFSSFEIVPAGKVFVTFDANGGTGGTTMTLDMDDELTAPPVTRDGYNFTGWSPEVPATATTSAVYTAQWEVIRRSSGGSSRSSSRSTTTPQTTTIVDETTPLSEFPIFYVDVADNSWYHDAIAYVTALELMNGVGDNHFAPDDNTTRGMVAVVMMRLASGEAIDSESFFDVADTAYYAEAAAWAVENGVFKGYDDGSFRGEINITREQFAAVLYRYALAKGYDVSAKADLGTYDDGALVGGYASEAMAWAVANGVIKGVGNNRLDPLGNATRAQLATMLMRFDELTKDVV